MKNIIHIQTLTENTDAGAGIVKASLEQFQDATRKFWEEWQKSLMRKVRMAENLHW